MFDVGSLLGQMMQTGMSGSSQNRMTHALGPQGLGRQGNPLSGILGGGGGAGGGGMGGMLGGLADVAQNMLQGAGGAVRQNNPMAIGGLGALAGGLFGGGSGALKGGAMALLGSLAVSALRNYGGSGTAATTEDLARDAPLGVRDPQTPAEEEALQHDALLAVRAMISAAKADGTIDLSEMQRIMGKLQEAGADDEARAFVDAEMHKPLDLDGLIGDVRSPESAVEVYAASLLAIEVDTPAEREYLQRLASGLGLEANTVNYIHEALGVTV